MGWGAATLGGLSFHEEGGARCEIGGASVLSSRGKSVKIDSGTHAPLSFFEVGSARPQHPHTTGDHHLCATW